MIVKIVFLIVSNKVKQPPNVESQIQAELFKLHVSVQS